MTNEDPHLSDERLLMDAEGELSKSDEKLVRAHLNECWNCRVRRQEMEQAIADFVHAHQQNYDSKLPPVAGPRALLKARLAEIAAGPGGRTFIFPRGFAWGAFVCALLILALIFAQPTRPRNVVVSVPDSRLTPGATLLVSRQAVCAQADAKNKAVPVALQRKVFEEYGIAGADPRAYEVDYLVTPALGGADDIHNLWPHSYAATVWNARVKDTLEDQLRAMVCDGRLDLTEAQREIATDWIAAYQKYFHTDEPLKKYH